MLKQAAGIHYIGNIEGRDILAGHSKLGHVDVVVYDGFVGNIVLKFYESVARLILRLVKQHAPDILQRTDVQEVFRVLDYAEYGGAPLLGVRGVSIICHGSSGAAAIKNALRVAVQIGPDRAQPAHRGGDSPRARRARMMPPSHRGSSPASGSPCPIGCVTNADLEKTLETSDQWIVERTGIRERRWRRPRTRWPCWRATPRPRSRWQGRDRARTTSTPSSSPPPPPTACCPRPRAICRRCSARTTRRPSTSPPPVPGSSTP